ncbi:MAG TPA: cation transporter, partial [Terriglobales bacterium]|nr:cation transporter [Terriglobales bacterium]
IYEGVVRLLRPPQLESAMWSYIVLGVAAIFDGGSLALGLRRLRHSMSREDSLLAALRRSKDPVVFTIVFQDAAAIAGVLIALVGIAFAHKFRNPQFDAAASILIGGLLAAVSFLLARECSHLLLGERAHRTTIEAVRRVVEKDPDVESASHPLTMQMGPHEVLLNLEIEFRDGLSTEQLESVIERLEKAIRHVQPDIKRIFIEANAFASKHHRRQPAA